MRLLITGGAGFIGSNFVHSALANKTLFDVNSIVVLDNLTYAGSKSNISEFIGRNDFNFVEGDIRDKIIVQELMSEIDVVVNFAAESHVDRSIVDSTPFASTNVVGVATLLEALAVKPNTIFVQISTDEVYGSLKSGSASEEYSYHPGSAYAASKAGGDLMALAFHNTFNYDIRITRCTNNFGPRQNSEKLIPTAIQKILENQKIPVYGDGKNVRDWMPVSDHIDGIRRAILNGRPGEIYNFGSSNEMSNLELLRMIIEQMGKDDSVLEFVTDRKGHDFRYSLNWQKANERLGFTPSQNFPAKLTETINWYLKNSEFLHRKV
jgi:dTDP-glucose 4,6-dehydratase